jgi:hypothetical protein
VSEPAFDMVHMVEMLLKLPVTDGNTQTLGQSLQSCQRQLTIAGSEFHPVNHCARSKPFLSKDFLVAVNCGAITISMRMFQ